MLTLTRISLQENFRKYYFEEFSRPDFISRGVILVVDFGFNITSIKLNSAAHGLLTFSFQKGITENSAWETAEESTDFFDARKHYASPSPADRKVDVERMVADVLSASPSAQFSEMVLKFVSDTSQQIR